MRTSHRVLCACALGVGVSFAACDHDPYTVGPVCKPGETRPCYTGPARTEGVGACKAGYRDCNEDREGFGECKYEVTPTAETCSTPEDDDCNGTNDEAGDCECQNGSTEACYGGPAETAGVGECRSGQHTCADGLWGECEGQSLPAVEDCTNLVDEDCDGVACAAPIWGILAGDGALQRVTGVASDAAGNVHVAGYFGGSIDFGGQPLQNVGGSDVFVAKLDAKGKPLWSRSFGTAAEEGAAAIATAPDGSVVVTGYFTADLWMGNTLLPNKGGSDAFVAKLDGATGDVLWAVKRGYDGNQQPRSVAVTPEGLVVVAGVFSGYLDCANDACGFAGVESAGGTDAFVLVLDENGGPHGRVTFGGAGNDGATAVTLDAKGEIVVAGDFADTVDFGTKTLVTSDSMDRDLFIATLAVSDLAVLDALQIGGDKVQQATALLWAGDALVLGGTTGGVVDLGFTTAGQAGLTTGFVAKLGASADVSWAHTFAAEVILPAALAAGPEGRVALAGTYGGSLDLATGPLMDDGGTNAFLVQLGSGGEVLWAKSFGRGDPGAFDEGCCVATAPNGEVLFGGGASSVFDFGLGPVPHAGGVDAAVARFSP